MKKKIIALLLAALTITTALAGCGGKDKDADPQPGPGTQSQVAASDVDVGAENQDSIKVKVTVPRDVFAGETDAEILSEAEAKGYTDCVINADGSMTCIMEESQQKELEAGFQQSMMQTLSDMVNGESSIESFERIEYTEAMDEFNIFVDQSKFQGVDSMHTLAFYTLGVYYQTFEGKAEDEIEMEVNFYDHVTNELIDSVTYENLAANAEG